MRVFFCIQLKMCFWFKMTEQVTNGLERKLCVVKVHWHTVLHFLFYPVFHDKNVCFPHFKVKESSLIELFSVLVLSVLVLKRSGACVVCFNWMTDVCVGLRLSRHGGGPPGRAAGVSRLQRVANEHSLSLLLAPTFQRGRQCGWPWQTVLRPPKPSSPNKIPHKGLFVPCRQR